MYSKQETSKESACPHVKIANSLLLKYTGFVENDTFYTAGDERFTSYIEESLYNSRVTEYPSETALCFYTQIINVNI